MTPVRVQPSCGAPLIRLMQVMVINLSSVQITPLSIKRDTSCGMPSESLGSINSAGNSAGAKTSVRIIGARRV